MTFQYSPLSRQGGERAAISNGGDGRHSLANHMSSAPDIQRYLHRFSGAQVIILETEKADVTVVVVDGWVECSRSLLNGERQIIDFLLPGDVVRPTHGSGERSYLDVRAVADSTVAIVPSVAWKRLVTERPEIRAATNEAEAMQRVRIQGRLLRCGRGGAPMRVAYVLLELLSRMWSKDLVQGCSFHMPVTQRMLGEYAGLSAVHVCRILRSFVKDGLLETGGHMDVHIKEPTRLAEIAGLDLPTIAEGLPVPQVDRMAS